MLVLVDWDASVGREKRDAEINDSDMAGEEVSPVPFSASCAHFLGSFVVLVACFIVLHELKLLPWLHLLVAVLPFPSIIVSNQVLERLQLRHSEEWNDCQI